MSASQNHGVVACIRLIGYAGQAGIADANDLQRKCAERFLVMHDIAARNNGSIHRQEEDRLMASFPTADAGLLALAEIFNRNMGSGIPLCAGMSFGSINNSGSEISGETVERSVCLLREANTAMIAVDAVFATALSESLHPIVRETGISLMEGDNEKISIFEISWSQVPEQAAQLTTPEAAIPPTVHETPQTGNRAEAASNEFASAPNLPHRISGRKLTLEFGELRVCLDATRVRATIGRATDCDIVVKDSAASRQHAVVEQTANGFRLTDKSTNGTYLSPENGEAAPIRNTSVLISGSGQIFIGRPPSDTNSTMVNFTVEPAST